MLRASFFCTVDRLIASNPRRLKIRIFNRPGIEANGLTTVYFINNEVDLAVNEIMHQLQYQADQIII